MIWWLIVCFAVFGIGVTKSGFGSGIGLMLVPTMALAMSHIPGRGSDAALGLMLPLLVTGDLLAVWQYRHLFSLKIVKKLLPGTAVGVVLGGALLWYLKHARSDRVAETLVQTEIGFESVLLVGLHWYRLWRGKAQHLMREPLRSHLTGGFAGVSSTLAHGAGPIIALYLLPLDLNRQLFVGTCAIYFFVLNGAKLPVYAVSGQFAHASPLFAIQFLPLVFAGALLGLWLNRRISDRWFSRVIYCVTFILGWYLLYEGVSGLVSVANGIR
jgi:uncharacterized membrane protein YfcA